MNLDEWIKLAPSQRNDIRLSWRGGVELSWNEDECYQLVSEACHRFKREFGDNILINNVQPGGCPQSAAIYVTTATYFPYFIEELPSRYLTFPVVQEPINDIRDAYLRCWHILLTELIGWTDDQINNLAKHWDDGLNGRDRGCFYHEDAFSYVLPHIVAESAVLTISQADQEDLYLRIQSAIKCEGSDPIWLSPYDWEAARRRVNDVLATVGGRLPIRKD